jgi:hypothetical protein
MIERAIIFTIGGMVAVVVLAAALPKLIHALVPLVLVLGVVIAVLRLVWWYTR